MEKTIYYVEDDANIRELVVYALQASGFHVIGFEKENIAAYLRVFMKDKVSKTVQIGRVLTVQRGKGFGEEILREGIRVAKEEMHAERVYIEAQCYAIGFYEKVGFQVSSGEFLEDGIPHVEMILELLS